MLASRYREEQAEYIAEGINVLYTEDNIRDIFKLQSTKDVFSPACAMK